MGSFPKYSSGGSYHWGKLSGRGLRTYHARLHTRYGWFVAHALTRAPHLIVDVGCGDAALTHLLADATGARVVGVEPEQDGVDNARRALRNVGSTAEVVQGTGSSLPVATGAATVVVMCEVIEHLEDCEAVLGEVVRVLSQDGQLLVSTPHGQETPADPLHVHEFRARELEDLLKRFFTDVELAVAEPSRLVDAYATRLGRVAVNAASLLGGNPFSVLRPPTPARRMWRQLYARSSHPRGR